MSAADPQDIWSTVEQWIAHARSDRRAADACLNAHPPLLDAASFHCQQAAEKLLKAALVWAEVPFRKTHDLVELGTAVAGIHPFLTGVVAIVEPWTTWNIAYRYPGDDVHDSLPSPEVILTALGVIDDLITAIQGLRNPV
jgi:HEPN domain-containing protein